MTYDCTIKVNGKKIWHDQGISSTTLDGTPEAEALAYARKHADELADVYAEQYPNQHLRVEVFDGIKTEPVYIAKRHYKEGK